MKEISLHILDLAQNSIDANADFIRIEVIEDTDNDILKITIEDNGTGMDNDLVMKVTDPFVTTRKTRNVGLGIPLTKAAAIRCAGGFNISSQKGNGTKVEFYFKHSHIDRAPIGDIGETIITLINSRNNVDIKYIHSVNGTNFVFDSKEIKRVLEDVDIRRADVLLWIKDYINDNIKEIRKNMELDNSNLYNLYNF